MKGALVEASGACVASDNPKMGVFIPKRDQAFDPSAQKRLGNAFAPEIGMQVDRPYFARIAKLGRAGRAKADKPCRTVVAESQQCWRRGIVLCENFTSDAQTVFNCHAGQLLFRHQPGVGRLPSCNMNFSYSRCVICSRVADCKCHLS